jgi:hypothetical protein
MSYERFVEINYYHELYRKGKMTPFYQEKLWQWIEKNRNN